jgi:NADH-quinone oxidoreductase subunit M
MQFFFFDNFIPLIIFFFFCFGLLISLVPENKLSSVATTGSVFIFFYTLLFWFFFNPLTTKFVALWNLNLFLSWQITFGVDAFAYFLILLTTFIFSLCFFTVATSVTRHHRSFLVLLIILELLIILVFCALDFLCFYLLFEISLIPMFLMIGFWGTHFRKTKAAYYLFLYTFFGSLFMLLAILFLFSQYGTTNYFVLLTNPVDPNVELILWPAIFFAFAVKVPMFPVHIWLPEAHVEAPTIGSVILAALVLKLGGFGMLRFLLPLFPTATVYYSPIAYTFALMGAVYAALTALRQLDLKRIVAYSSIAHMNVGLLGLFSQSVEGIAGFYYVMLGHGLISSALFFLVGVLYDRYHSRLYLYYSGLAQRMPLFAGFFFFFTVSNIAFPGTFNFFAEVLVLLSLSKQSFTVLLITLVSLFVSTIYAFWLFNRSCFGTLNTASTLYYYDLTRLEFTIFFLLTFFVLLGGLFPNSVMSMLYTSILVQF